MARYATGAYYYKKPDPVNMTVVEVVEEPKFESANVTEKLPEPERVSVEELPEPKAVELEAEATVELKNEEKSEEVEDKFPKKRKK